MAMVYLGIGSNLGDRTANCETSLIRIGSLPRVVLKARSSFYETCPVGGPPQDNYINGAVAIETDLPPADLIDKLRSIERDMGRNDASAKDHPRIIDIDILLYGGLLIDTPCLKVPHPRMHERCFVLKGLAEIAPYAAHPVLGRTVIELYNEACAPEE